jgi:hypothetical protein
MELGVIVIADLMQFRWRSTPHASRNVSGSPQAAVSNPKCGASMGADTALTPKTLQPGRRLAKNYKEKERHEKGNRRGGRRKSTGSFVQAPFSA